MPPPDKTTYDDSVLVKYLVGSLPETDAERLDELSVSDKEVADRLEGIENDLVDSWARGELSGELLEQVNRVYRSSPQRIGKLRFAQAFSAHQVRIEATSRSGTAMSTFRPKRPSPVGIQRFPFSEWLPKWAPAAIALVALVSSAYLATINARLRRELAQQTARRQTLEAKQQEISHELAAQNVETRDAEQITASQPSSNQLHLTSVLLLPAMRGANGIATVSIPAHADQVTIRLQLEANDFPAYGAALRDPSLGQIVWHQEHLRASTEKGKHVVSFSVPAGLLKERNYLFELIGVRTGGEEILATYPFRVAK